RQHTPEKNQRENMKPRDRISMESFLCHGWLHITIFDGDNVTWVKISHSDDHIHYSSIDVPPQIVKLVHKNHKLTPTQLWDEILKIIPNPTFTCKVIHHMLLEINSTESKCDPNKLKSANILLEEFKDKATDPATGKKPLYSVEPIPLKEEAGFTAIAFSLPPL
ncbi:hypothetical protein C8J57DRAFT_991091, partial [Mycena rebaudengoi]